MLELYNSMPSTINVASQHMRNVLDITVLLLALVQLKEPWTDGRVELASLAILYKTLSLKQKPDHKRSLASIMQQYLIDYPAETTKCILLAYKQSCLDPSYAMFFNLLYDACSNIPRFIPALLQISRLPDVPNLRLLLHLIFLEAMNHGNVNVQEQLGILLRDTGITLIKVLLQLLDEYANKRYFVLSDPNLVLEVIQFVKFVMSESEVPAALKQSFVNIMTVLKPTFAAPPSSLQAKQWLQAWLSMTIPEKRDMLVGKLLSLAKSEDGLALVQLIGNEAVHLLMRVESLQMHERSNLRDLILLLLSNQLMPSEQLDEVIFFECLMYKSEPSRPLLLFGQDLLNSILPFLCAMPNYIPYVLSTNALQQTPRLYNELLQAYTQYKKSSTAVEVNLTAEELARLKKRQAELTRPIEPLEAEVVPEPQDEHVKTRVSVLINNTTAVNIDAKTAELVPLIAQGSEAWFADFFVRSRVARQNNYHELYLELLKRLETQCGPVIGEEVLHKSMAVAKEILHADDKTFAEQHTVLRCMGEWLGSITLAHDVCLSQLHLNLTEELLRAFAHKRLLYVFEFVCYVLRGCKKSTVMHPPQPWLMALLSLLKELSLVPGVNKNLPRIYQNMMSFVPFDDDAVPLLESEVFLAVPEVANNPDFTAEASQAEVVAFFKDRYPVMVKLTDGEPHPSFTQKKAYPEFIPKSAQVEPQLAVTLGDEVKTLTLKQQNEIQTIIHEKMTQIVSVYSKGIGMSHCQIAISSLQAMYVRDLVEVKSAVDVLACLEKASKTITESLLFSMLPVIEKEFLESLYGFFRNASDMVTDSMINTVVKNNMASIAAVLAHTLQSYVMKNMRDMVMKEHDINYHNVTEHGKNMPLAQFLTLDGITENERVTGGALTDTQRAVYEKLAGAPVMTEAVMSDDELASVSVSMNYLRIADLMHGLLSAEGNTMLWHTRPTYHREVKRALEDCERFLESIEGRHLPNEDVKLLDLLLSAVHAPNFFLNYHLMGEVVELAALFAAHSVSDVRGAITALTLDALTAAKQRALVVSFLLLLAGKKLLDVAQLDVFFTNIIRSNSLVNEHRRTLFLCFVDLVLTHEAVTMEELPSTMREIRAVAKADEGKRVFRFENKVWSYELLLVALEKKAEVVRQRAQLMDALKTEPARKLARLMTDCIQRTQNAPDVAKTEEAFSALAAAFDAALQAPAPLPVFAGLYVLLLTALQQFAQGAYGPTFASYAPVDAATRALQGFVAREKGAHRVVVFKAELECLQALFYQAHDFNDPPFVPPFFLRLLLGLLKMVVVGEPDEATRDELLFVFSSFLYATAPTNAPLFVVYWLQVVSMPQVLYLMIDTKKPKLVALENDIVLRLLMYTKPLCVQDIKRLSERLLKRIYDFISCLLVSFPGFMVRRASEYCLLVPDDLRFDILYDCPPECNPSLATMGDDTFLERAWATRVEPTMKYRQDLERVNLVDAAEKVMASKDVGNSLQMIHHVLEVPDVMQLFTLRALVMFWVMEEKRIHDRADSNVTVKLPEECLLMLFDEIASPNLKMEMIITLEDYIRFPCKETELFMNTFIGLYRRMDPETARMMMEDMYFRNRRSNGQMGIVMTLKNIQRK